MTGNGTADAVGLDEGTVVGVGAGVLDWDGDALFEGFGVANCVGVAVGVRVGDRDGSGDFEGDGDGEIDRIGVADGLGEGDFSGEAELVGCAPPTETTIELL